MSLSSGEPTLDEHRLRRLIDVGRTLVAELDLERVLDRILDAARELTGARYAALGVLDEERRELERFLTRGIDEDTHRAIGSLPRGHGILGLLIEDPRPLRLHDLGAHPRSYGFPAGHPEMTSFLGVPVKVRGEAWGNLYLTEKDGGQDFTAADEESVVILADWAGIAIDNARLHQRAEDRRGELERAVKTLEATTEITRAVGDETGLSRILELIVKRGRALVGAGALIILLAERDELVVAAGAGEIAADLVGTTVPMTGSVSGDVFSTGRAERLADVSSRLRFSLQDRLQATTALFVPLSYRGDALGVIAAFDRIPEESGLPPSEFQREQERLMEAFATSAGIAVATARNVRADRLRQSIAAAERERGRWARELHDETLQGLGGLRLLLSAALRHGDETSLRETVEQAVGQLAEEVTSLRALIAELRPAALDELGLEPAIESLAERTRSVEGLVVELGCSIASRLDPELESTVYRLVQEALTNVAKHARAEHVGIAVTLVDGHVEIEVRDDGVGIDLDHLTGGFGLAGMRERTALVGGTFEVESLAPGTRVHASLPARGPVPSAGDPGSGDGPRSAEA